MVTILQQLHSRGIIHCDLKPDNVLIGNYMLDREEMNKIYLIDFGISMRYREQNGQHVKFRKKIPFRGNIIFSSKHALLEYQLSRRDDIISFIYMLSFCLCTDFKWISLNKPIIN